MNSAWSDEDLAERDRGIAEDMRNRKYPLTPSGRRPHCWRPLEALAVLVVAITVFCALCGIWAAMDNASDRERIERTGR